MPSREKRLAMAARAAAQREAAKTDPGVALMLKKKRTAIRKMLATRAAKKAAAAVPAEPAPEPTAEEKLEIKRANLADARAVMAKKRAEGTYTAKPKVWSNPDPSTLGGRIDLMLAKLGKKRGALEHAIAAGNGFVAGLHRNPTWGMRRERAVLVAGFLGVSVEWLLDGGDAPAEPAALIPHAATVLKANGKHHPSHEARIEHAMQANVDTTITALWSLLPMDAKVMVIARVAELVAMQGKK